MLFGCMVGNNLFLLIQFFLKWRDHWMQAIYFPKNLLDLQKNELFYIKCNHDEYSLWFDVQKKMPEHSFASNINQNSLTIESFMNQEVTKVDTERSLGATLVSRNRLAQLNDSKNNEMLVSLLKKVTYNAIFDQLCEFK